MRGVGAAGDAAGPAAVAAVTGRPAGEAYADDPRPGRPGPPSHPPDWGLGQVQTVDGARVTVNLDHAGKQLIDVAAVPLIESEPD